MAIEQDEIEKIAELARIRIPQQEIGELTQRITAILGMVDQLQAADTAGVEPMANPLDATQALRPDEVTEPNRREARKSLEVFDDVFGASPYLTGDRFQVTDIIASWTITELSLPTE